MLLCVAKGTFADVTELYILKCGDCPGLSWKARLVIGSLPEGGRRSQMRRSKAKMETGREEVVRSGP